MVCLQELKATDNKFPWRAIENADYRAVWHGQKSWNGVVILEKDRSPTSRDIGPGRQPYPIYRGDRRRGVVRKPEPAIGNLAPGPKFEST